MVASASVRCRSSRHSEAACALSGKDMELCFWHLTLCLKPFLLEPLGHVWPRTLQSIQHRGLKNSNSQTDLERGRKRVPRAAGFEKGLPLRQQPATLSGWAG